MLGESSSLVGRRSCFSWWFPRPRRLDPNFRWESFRIPPRSITRTSIIAGFSFLLHFLLAGAFYSDWLDPLLDEGITVRDIQVVQSLPDLPVDSPTEPTHEDSPSTRPSAQPTNGGKGPSATPSGATRGSASLSQELDAIEMETLASLGNHGPATAGVLRNSEVPTIALDDAARSDRGVSAPSLVLHGGKRVGPMGVLADLGRRGKADGTDGVGESEHVGPPKGRTFLAPPRVGGGVLPNAEAVMAGLRAGFHRCYQRGLDDYPDASGGVRLTLHVGPNGEVQGVDAVPSGGLPGSIVSCMQSRASVARFESPQGGSALVVVPVSVTRQKD